jgi:hypothetical protein
MAELISAVHDVVDAEENAITIRHLFYRLVGLNVIEKTERAYKSSCQHLSRHITPPMFNGLADALRRTRETYRRDLWSQQPSYVEVWVEKDAIAGVIDDVTSEWGVPLFVCRGFASLSSMYSASLTFKDAQREGKEVTICHLGDYDPSGHAAADAIERTFRETFDCSVNFERIAILPEHITEFELPTRPTKRSDSRARNWAGSECVELDSLPPAELRGLVNTAIVSRIERDEWDKLQEIEKEERKTLEQTLAQFEA